MKVRTYMIAILVTALCTAGGLYLPSFSFAQKNRAVISHPNTAEMDSTSIRYTSSLADILQIVSSDYRVIDYNSVMDSNEYYQDTYDEIAHKAQEFIQLLKEIYNIDLPEKKVIQNEINPIIIMSEYSNMTDISIEDGFVDYDSGNDIESKSQKDPAITAPAQATMDNSNNNTTSRYADAVNNIAFVWLCNYFTDESYLDLIIDDSSGYVVAFNYHTYEPEKEISDLNTMALKEPNVMANLTNKLLNEYYKDSLIEVSIDYKKYRYYDNDNKKELDVFYSDMPLNFALIYSDKNKGDTEEAYPFQGIVKISETELSMNLSN